jgi:hypothetical protein
MTTPVSRLPFLAPVILAVSVLTLQPGCGVEPTGPTVSRRGIGAPAAPFRDPDGGSDIALAGDARSFDSEVPNTWYGLLYDITRSEVLSPPVSSRIIGYAGVALYEALAGGMTGYRSLVGQLNEFTYVPSITPGLEYHWPTVANAVLARVLREFFGDRQNALESIHTLHDQFAAEFRSILDADVYRRSVLHGREVAQAVLAWAGSDGFNELAACAYVPPAGDGLWVPTPPAYAPALQPCWGRLRTPVTSGGSSSDPGPPPKYSTVPGSPFYLEAEEVFNTVAGLTDEQLAIALFWSDDPGLTGTPPGHSVSICRQIIEQEGFMLDVAAEAYAKVGLAVHEAFINCWWTKFEYNLLRPVTYIRDLWDPKWLPPLNTPPFPEYTSGHSVQSPVGGDSLYGSHA